MRTDCPARSSDLAGDASWEGTRRWQMTRGMDATPDQRLAWLEEMIALFYRAGLDNFSERANSNLKSPH